MKPRSRTLWLAAPILSSLLINCNSVGFSDTELVGEVEVALTNAPTDVSCLTLKIVGDRTDIRTFDVRGAEKQVYRMKGLPVGKVTLSANAFAMSCQKLTEGTAPTWYSEALTTKIQADRVTQIALAMVHNGQASVAVDFNETNGSESGTPTSVGPGVTSSSVAYLVAQGEGMRTKAMLTAGDTVGTKPDGEPYRMVGTPDGMGAFDNGDGTFTLLVNHELSSGAGVVRAHGAKGAFISKWVVRQSDLTVISGSDLIESIALWDTGTSTYKPAAKGVSLNRLCSADLPLRSALYDDATSLGFDGRLFINGEETGTEGRAFAHGQDGVSYELPRLGKASWENVVASPKPASTTTVAALDDSNGGQIYFYVGTKTNSGTSVERAGLTNGKLFGMRALGVPTEDATQGIADGPIGMYDFGNVDSWTGEKLELESTSHAVTSFQRPEDGAWDPVNPNHFYFATTANFSGRSRLWRVSLEDASKPELGGTLEMLLDGTEGQHMLDNLTLDQLGHVYLQEDPGNNAHLAKVWRYEIASGQLTEVLHFDPDRFVSGAPHFITEDEESSGIIDAATFLAPGWFLMSVQSYAASSDGELVEGGQLVAFFDPAAVQ